MPEVDAVDVVVGWLDAMRRNDIPAVETFFHADVVWGGIGDAKPCSGRDEVMELLEGGMEGRLGAHAVEVIAGDDGDSQEAMPRDGRARWAGTTSW